MTQSKALEILKSGKSVFLTGEPGAGKTYTINQFTQWLRDQEVAYAITASTGIAATHVGGVTIHSWSGIKIKKAITDNALQNMMMDERLVARLCESQVLIVDEVSMLDANFINMLDQVLKRVRGEVFMPFGGIQVVFVGDFFQLPPVSRDGPVDYAFKSQAWKDAELTVCYLTEQHRQSEPVYLDLLKAMRDGTIEEKHKNILRACVTTAEPGTHLYTHNVDVDLMNDAELEKLPGDEHVYRARFEGDQYSIEFLKKSCITPEILRLKEGALVMFTRNNFDEGYVNGSIGTVIRFEEGQPVVQITDGTIIRPERAEWEMEDSGRVKASMRQYPLRLAWAITVHKSQGMSLDSAAIDLSRCFEFGQGYVAISRVRSLAGLHLEGLNAKAFAIHPDVVEADKMFREKSNELR